ncbi:uncharacterized protein BDV14DRAFT_79153 [Aspergillus stella-maris]|uniref:uncharacterized protein n=1 Tax=Aspergillus stella-maris TaxID=1810926 RepID=UPI003CCD86A9
MCSSGSIWVVRAVSLALMHDFCSINLSRAGCHFSCQSIIEVMAGDSLGTISASERRTGARLCRFCLYLSQEISQVTQLHSTCSTTFLASHMCQYHDHSPIAVPASQPVIVRTSL